MGQQKKINPFSPLFSLKSGLDGRLFGYKSTIENPMYEYFWLIQRIKDYLEKEWNCDDAVIQAIKDCREKGILVGFVQKYSGAAHLPFLCNIPGRNIIFFQKDIHIPAAADQHYLCKSSGMDILKTCDLFSVTDAGTDHRFQVFLIIAFFLTLSAEHGFSPPAYLS